MLPRLLYIGDVPVTRTVAGPLQLYRLLQNYPNERLAIVEANLHTSFHAARLPNVSYRRTWVCPRRATHSRWSKQVGFLALHWLRHRPLLDVRSIQSFRPEAVLTIAHGFSWQLAARIARRCDLPLSLIVHDHWPSSVQLPAGFAPVAEEWFGQVYRQATARLCISPYMAAYCTARYHAPATVLYPTRAQAHAEFQEPPARTHEVRRCPVVAYAGSISTPGYAAVLMACARAVQRLGGTLQIFGPDTSQQLERLGIRGENVVLQRFVPEGDLLTRLRAEADILLLPMSFEPCDRLNMEISFPSKLTEYTGAVLPILALAPSYSSVAHWARSNAGVAELVEALDEGNLARAITSLAQNPARRIDLARAAHEYGRIFSPSEDAVAFHDSVSMGVKQVVRRPARRSNGFA
jgi:glycosyltransferase involved in cell wall biosynthesis